ncbi:TldD/PmbA family protein [Ornithinicoccus halotolerans]|uniref:TldD/PmbA family protein n=1 Tax=Ornithinicoccus halotolerans TaxID=1748220 RepID=UPI001296B064|nr:TldD/PmbA family protein [Ornithinicoccus halotolerans]
MPEMDPTFTALPLRALADAALDRARTLGASHADLRVMRTNVLHRVLRDSRLESSGDRSELGLSVRVVHDGSWGFAAGVVLTPEEAARLAEQAVAMATVARPLVQRPVELAPEPVHADRIWVSSYQVNPFEVPESDRLGRLTELSERLLAADPVHHATTTLLAVQENTFYADLAGTSTTQQRVRVEPSLEAVHVGEQGFVTMSTVAPPAGRGWEYLTGAGWDFDDEVERLPEWLAEHAAAPSVEAGRYDLVIEPSNLWLTIHESVAHGTELDRALGYEAAYAGTSFATFDQLGSLQYGSQHMTVTGDRVTEHGLATVGYDDEGVAAQSFQIIRDGVLVGYQLNRQMAQEKGFGRSNGCAYADSAGHIPLQRMPNVSLQADPDGPDVADLISDVDDGIYVVGNKSWSIDMQRYNFQFTGQRFYRIRDGRLAGQVKDVAYQATTTEFWGSMDAVGGPSTYLLAGTFNCGKGQPGQGAPVSHGSPAARFRDVNVLNTSAEGSH